MTEAETKRLRALEFQRVRQQGKGRPIISTEANGTRFVAIGSRVAYGKWPTFQDFLFYYVKNAFGLDWGQAELAKPAGERHPYIQWMGVVGELMKKHASPQSQTSGMPGYGAARAVLGLAYDLYLIEHHAESEQDQRVFQQLLERLRQPDHFFGARHEVRVAGILLRAGFVLSWEDDAEGRAGGYAEYIATFPQTACAFWVECKMRQPETDNARFRFTHLVSAALHKQTNLARLVCVELNQSQAEIDDQTGGWAGAAINQLRRLENQPSSSGLPPAFVLLSNFPEHHQLDTVGQWGALLEGFKTSLFRSENGDLWDAIIERQNNPEMESLWQSLQEHSAIPATFDGSLPGVDESTRLVIGRSYVLPDGQVCLLEDAIVVEAERAAMGTCRLPDGTCGMVRFDLTEGECEAWKSHPETFFGEVRRPSGSARTPLDMYDFFLQAHEQTPTPLLLSWLQGHDDPETLRALPRQEILKRYAYALTGRAIQLGGPPAAPLWQERLRPWKKPKDGA
jgi:hypothetical protein